MASRKAVSHRQRNVILIACAIGVVLLVTTGVFVFLAMPAPLPEDSIVVPGCHASNRQAINQEGTLFGAMECADGVVILAPIGEIKQQRHEVPSVERPRL